MDTPFDLDEVQRAAFRLSWPGQGRDGQPDRRRAGRLASLLGLALPGRNASCTGWPITLSVPRRG